MKTRNVPAFVLALVASLWISAAAAAAQDGLTQMAGPKGGQIVYGPVPSATSVQQALGGALRYLHGRFGVRPDVGRVVQVRESGASTLRFSAKPAQGAPVAGMIVVAQGAHGYEAGAVFDEASRLATSFPPMLQALTTAWHPGATGPEAGGGGGPAAPLRTVVLRDNSARVRLPEGWRIDPQSAGGSILATGPNGEFAALGAPYFVIDPRSPAGRQAQSSGGRLYGGSLFYPYGQPLGRTFADLTRMLSEHSRSPVTPMRVDSEEPMANRNGAHCARLRGEGGIVPGHGAGSFDTVFCVSPPMQGSWIALAYHVAAPTSVAGQERNTLLAMRNSFEENQAVIMQQANTMAGPVIAQIHEIGRQSQLAAAQADATRVEMRNTFEANNNSRERSAQGFTNYLRDQTVILDANTGEHATTWNGVAESMVKNEPNRYSYVDTPGYWKGVDY